MGIHRNAIASLILGLVASQHVFGQSWEHKGTWAAPYDWGICAINMSLLPDQTLVVWNWNRDRPLPNLFAVKVITSSPGTHDYANVSNVPFTFRPLHSHEIFCAGHTPLANGNLFIAGGHILSNIGVEKVKLFDYKTWGFTEMSSMTPYPDTAASGWNGRWYPTTISLPNGDFAILSGARDVLSAVETVPGDVVSNDFPELWTPPVSILGDGISRMLDATTGNPIHRILNRNYPHAFIHPVTGKLIVLGSNTSSDEKSTAGTNHEADLASLTWRSVYPYRNSESEDDDVPATKVDYPSSVMIDGIIIRSGGAGNGAEGPDDDPDVGNRAMPATANALFMKLTDNHLSDLETEHWYKAPISGEDAGKMVLARKNHTLVALPDGKVLAMGGCLKRNNPSGVAIEGAAARSFPEMWDPLTPDEPWKLLAAPAPGDRIGRPYHSTSLLLPDARVIIAGGENEFIGNNLIDTQRTMQLFSPPYGGVEEGGIGGWRIQQPEIHLAGNAESIDIRYGEPFTIAVTTPVQGRRIKSISMISLGSTTHAFNENQQFVFLYRPEEGKRAPGPITLDAPANANVARPGYYMLFAVDVNGIPSNAKIIRLRDFEPFGPISVTIPSSLGSSDSELRPQDIRISENKYLGGVVRSNSSGQAELIVDAVGDFDRVTGIRLQTECRRAPSTALVELDAYIYDYKLRDWVRLGERVVVNGTEQVFTFKHSEVPFAETSQFCTSWFDPVQARVKLHFTDSESFSLRIDAIRLAFRTE